MNLGLVKFRESSKQQRRAIMFNEKRKILGLDLKFPYFIEFQKEKTTCLQWKNFERKTKTFLRLFRFKQISISVMNDIVQGFSLQVTFHRRYEP